MTVLAERKRRNLFRAGLARRARTGPCALRESRGYPDHCRRADGQPARLECQR